MPRHKHADVIHAYAEGDEIEVYDKRIGWDTVPWPSFYPSLKYRIKPKTVKKEGWVNVYSAQNYTNLAGLTSSAYQTKERADLEADSNRVACVRIEWWEEEQ
jgi:hypothetical protein